MNIAVLGATGAVGRTMLEVLAEREVPMRNALNELEQMASAVEAVGPVAETQMTPGALQ